jgi:hypothetical protein
MKRICLTIDINVNDKCFNDFFNYEKINIGDIVKQEEINLKPLELQRIRGKIVAKQIRKIKKDLLIGFAIRNQDDLKTVLELSGSQEEDVFKIYFDNGKRKKAAIEKYKRDYSLHSRWLDYSPEFVEHSYREFGEEVENIKIYATENMIELIAI